MISQICLTKAEAGDVILLYFAGHAFIDERSGEGYIALTNSRYQDTNTSLSLLSFAQHVMARSAAAQILCIVDCFQTGQIWNMRRTSTFDAKPLLGPTVLSMLQAQPNRLLMTSCRGNDYAPEVGERGLGLLMHSMVIGLTGPATDAVSGQVTLQNLHSYLFNTLGEQQRPQLFGQPQIPFVMVGELPDSPATSAFVDPQPVGAAGVGVPPTPIFHPTLPGKQATGNLLRQAAPFASTSTLTPQPGNVPQSPAPNPAAAAQQQTILQQAQQYYQEQNYEKAFDLVEQALRIAPQDKDALILKGQLLGTAGRYNEARQTIEQLLQVDPNNAMGWSMRAVVLSNQGHYKQALESIERSLELDAQNPESYAIKNNITESMALAESQAKGSSATGKFKLPVERTSTGKAFWRGLGLHILGILMGGIGFALLSVASIPYPVGLVVASLGLAVLVVNATRGAFRYGILFLVLTVLIAVIGLAGLFGLYKQSTILFDQLSVHPSLLRPITFVLLWLIAAITLPLIGSLGGLISRAVADGKKSKQ
ncbi:tetratricopeptide repeat protein [Ktedonobacteria bacterium brp13]|nr:tetratricopeptide repeat protein [Ktedonobacteria bacterium brp13]